MMRCWYLAHSVGPTTVQVKELDNEVHLDNKMHYNN